MALFKVADVYPDYRESFFDGRDIKGVDVYAIDAKADGESDKVGNVDDILIDETGRIRYLVVDTGFWIFGKRVLLPIGRCVDDPESDRIYATNLTKAQVNDLPAYSDDMTVDFDYEEQVRSVYRMPSVETTAPVEMSVPVEQAGRYAVPSQAVQPADYPYEEDPVLYGMNNDTHKRLRLYEERLVADKKRRKTGGVTISKKIVTDVDQASVPVQKEKIVIEIESVQGETRINAPDDSFQDGEKTRFDVYEEQADIRKEPVVYQEVNIRKEIDTDTVTAREELRREELDVHTDGDVPLTEKERQIDSRF